MTSQPINVGFVDLATIGALMASHRIHAGHLPFIYTRGKIPAAVATSRSTHCVSARGVAKRAGIIILTVPARQMWSWRGAPKKALPPV